MLGNVTELGINTNEIQSFLSNQLNLRKGHNNNNYNGNPKNCIKHRNIGSNLISLCLVFGQRLVIGKASRAQSSVREEIRAARGSGKSFSNCISKLNRLAKQVTDELDHKN